MRIKKICCMVIIFAMLFSCLASVPTYAEDLSIPSKIIKFSEAAGLSNLIKVRPLYSPNEELFGYCAEGVGCYIIYDTEDSIVEYSTEGESKYSNVNSKLYYGGPLNYYVKSNDYFKDLCSYDLISYEDFYSTATSDHVNDSNLKEIRAVDTCSVSSEPKFYTTTIDGDVDYYDPNWNNDGSCGQLAATAVLAYLQAVFNIGIPSFLVTNPYYLYLSLKGIIPHVSDGYGTYPNQMVSGLNAFATQNKYMYYAHYSDFSSTVYSQYKNKINEDVPSIIDITGHHTYKDHWAIGVGYRTVIFEGNVILQCMVDDGWGNPSVVIDNSYVDGILFVDPK